MRLSLLLILLTGVSWAGAVQQDLVPNEQVARHLAVAQEAEKSQDYPAASREYQEILKQQPKLAMIRQSLAVTYHLQNRYLDAIDEFQRALRLDPTMWGSCLFLGMDYYKTNQFSLAITPLHKSISLNARMAEPEARFWLAVTYSALDRQEDAVREFRRDLVLRPGNLDVLYHLTEAYDDASAAAFQRLGVIEPRAAAVSLLQAERFLDENRRDLASLQYRNALELRPDFAGWIPALARDDGGTRATQELEIAAADARANLELAGLLAGAGDVRQSTSVLQNLANQKAANAEAAHVIEEAVARLARMQNISAPVQLQNGQDILAGLELIRQGHFREAERPLSHAAEKNSTSFLQLLLIRSYVESGDCEPVQGRLRQMLAAEPENVDVLLFEGLSYKRQAESTLQQMIQIDPDSYGVHQLLGKQHEEKTEYDLAIKEYQAALAKRPDLGGMHYAIGNVYRKMSQYAEAEKWLMEELSRNPYHGMAHFRLGSIYIEQGKPNAAISHLLEALKSHPQLIEARVDLGRAYTADGKYEDAIASLKSASRLDPTNDRVHYLLSIAYSKEGRKADALSEMAAYHRLTRDRLQRTQQDVKDLSNSLDR